MKVHFTSEQKKNSFSGKSHYVLVFLCVCFQGGENNVAIDLIVRHVRTQLEQVRISVRFRFSV